MDRKEFIKKLDDGYYSSVSEKRPQLPKNNCSKCGKYYGGVIETAKYCANCGNEIFNAYVQAREQYCKDMDEWSTRRGELHKQFREDCLAVVGLDKHSKRYDIFAFCEDARDTESERFQLLDELTDLFMQ